MISENSDPDEHVSVEVTWIGTDKWKRVVRSEEFTQTLIVNGDRILEQDSEDYMPLGIRVLTTAMLDPDPVLAALRPGDTVQTKANGLANESGRTCPTANAKFCQKSPYGLSEFVGAPGQSIEFTDYRAFDNKRVARLLIYHVDATDRLLARILTLGRFSSQDESAFVVNQPTPKDQQIRRAIVPETDLRSMALQPLEIIWPQILEDKNTRGQTSYYLSLDKTGQVREVLPLSLALDRADDSARRQIMKWKFKPFARDGIPVQAEGILSFEFDTRKYGPPQPLTNEQVRSLATEIVEPIFPPGSTPGTAYVYHVAVDDDGQVIELSAVSGPYEMSKACFEAIRKWHFHPIIEDGKPRPYRAEITFKVPEHP